MNTLRLCKQARTMTMYNICKQLSSKSIKIGHVVKYLIPAIHPELVPTFYLPEIESKTLNRHLQWILQKDLIGQDMFLVGPPGSYRRKLIMAYAELTHREIEYVSLSRDTTESDLKQRREIVNNSAVYIDQCALQAALNGRLLILDGIEKAERNVLPILNNLLENREMQLEDGRFLLRAQVYDQLVEKHSIDKLETWKFLRCNDNFRVIALGLPVPLFRGNSLDPPLRSRFQARFIDGDSYTDMFHQIESIYPSIDKKRVDRILSLIHCIRNEKISNCEMPYFPVDNVVQTVGLLNNFPEISDAKIIESIYPFRLISKSQTQNEIEKLYQKFNLMLAEDNDRYFIKNVVSNKIVLESMNSSLFSMSKEKLLEINCEPTDLNTILILTDSLKATMADLMISHSLGDYCIIGPQGSGRSSIVETLAIKLGARLTHVVLYGDMTARDLLQQRETDPVTGNTVWRNSALVKAALSGDWAVLGGLHRLEKGCMAVLNQLITDRQLQLFDGSRLLRWDRFDELKTRLTATDKEMNERGIYRIHPDFRIIAIAESPSIPGESSTTGVTKRVDWLSAEIMSAFRFHSMPALTIQDEKHVLGTMTPDIKSEKLDRLLDITHKLRNSEDSQIRDVAQILSLRQLLRISKRLSIYPCQSVVDAVQKACLSKFLPKMVQETLIQTLEEFHEEVKPDTAVTDKLTQLVEQYQSQYHPRLHQSVSSESDQDEARVPNVLFYDSVEHSKILIEMVQSFLLGYKPGDNKQHLLLIGNQGVGKNKITDRFLQLLGRPREYIQLHRDTTVQTLTLQASIKNGRIAYHDSPLVRAVSRGYVLVVDEADKASTQVTCILKNLLTLGDMELSDGRRILADHRDVSSWPESEQQQIIRIHPQFRMIVLANRPGFPFLGNDFFGAMGDVFSCHAVDNPDPASETTMLQKYGPSVPAATIRRLVALFGDLRGLADQGQIQYPYSTREIVNVVRHLEKYPMESLSSVLGNVFDFDVSNSEMLHQIEGTLEKHGVALAGSQVSVSLGTENPLPAPISCGKWQLGRRVPDGARISSSNYVFEESVTVEPELVKLETDFTRSRIFSELEDCVSIRLGEYNVVADMVTGFSILRARDSSIGTEPEEFIHFATLNPLQLTTLTLKGNGSGLAACRKASKITFGDMFPAPQGNFRPRVRLATFPSLEGEEDGSCVLFHEACTNVLLHVNTVTGRVLKLGTSDWFPEKKPGRFSNWPGANQSASTQTEQQFNMLCDWSRASMSQDVTESPFVVFHRPGEKSFIVMETKVRQWHRIYVPFPVRSVFLPGRNRWIVLDMEKRPYLLDYDMANDSCGLVEIHRDDADRPMMERIFPGSVTTQSMATVLGNSDNSSVSVGTSRHNYCEFWPTFRGDETTGLVSKVPRESEATKKSTLLHTSSNVLLGSLDANSGTQETIIVNTLDSGSVPRHLISRSPLRSANTRNYLEVIHLSRNTVKYIQIPSSMEEPTQFQWLKHQVPDVFVSVLPSSKSLITMDPSGSIHMWTVSVSELTLQLAAWKRGIGADNDDGRDLKIEKLDGDMSLNAPKHGKVDADNAPHVGGNTWAGGTGGRDTAGLGGVGGPYRLDAGHDVYQVPDSVKNAVPEHVKAAARQMGQKAWQERLRDIRMSELDYELYMRHYRRVEAQIGAIRVLLDSLQAASEERQWLRHQTHGDLDDSKLVEGVLGERNIYRARVDKLPEPGSPQIKPKRLRLIVDVSGSMYRFNGHDKRLERQMEAVLLLMEAFQHASPDRLIYEVFGHSGEGPMFPFISLGHPPANEKERMDVLAQMLAHTQFCMSGDHTLEALEQGLSEMGSAIDSESPVPVDQAILVLLSDANLPRYGIKPASVARLIQRGTRPPLLQAYVVLIGGLGDQASQLQRDLPPGRAFICLNTDSLPQILSTIFTGSLIPS